MESVEAEAEGLTWISSVVDGISCSGQLPKLW